MTKTKIAPRVQPMTTAKPMKTMPASDGSRNERFPPGQTGTRGRHRAIWKSKRGRHVEPERSVPPYGPVTGHQRLKM